MPLKTADQYLASLRRMKPEVYVKGEKIQSVLSYPLFQPSLKSWGCSLYDAAFDSETKDVMIADSDITNDKVHVFWHIPHNTDELLQNLKAAYKLSERSPVAGYASIGRDELVALLVASYEMDHKFKTSYYPRVLEYVKYFQKEQIMTAAAVTDVKGDRGFRPADQKDPDMYLHIVEKRDNGIVVRGAKAHTTGAIVSNELIVIPQRAMREKDKDYAVAFAIPVDTPGVKLISRATGASLNILESPMSSKDDVAESLTIFDNVFVPQERIFMKGEWEYTGLVANAFANINRQGYVGADYGKLNIYIGAAALIADYNGVSQAPHIRDKITEMIKIASSIWATGVASSVQHRKEGPGIAIPDPVITNAGKHLCMEGHYVCTRLLHEIAGGAVATLPFAEDIEKNPETARYIEKYLRGVPGVPTMDRIRLFKFIRDIAASEYGGWWLVEIIHGSGSPAAERIQMFREYDVEAQKRLVKRLAHIES